MTDLRQQTQEAARSLLRKWAGRAAARDHRGVRCGWALGTGSHPAVDQRLNELALDARAQPRERARWDRRAFLLGEADILAAVAQHRGLMVEKVTSQHRGDGSVSIRLRGALGLITVTISSLGRAPAPSVWTVKGARLTAETAAPIAVLAPSWASVVLDAPHGRVELRSYATRGHPPAWRQAVERAWRARLGE